MTQVIQGVDVRPQSGWTGAEIRGVDLTTAVDQRQVAEIRAALLKWKVVFFRDQFIDHDDHLRFASAFGAPTPAHPLFDSIPDPELPDDLSDLPRQVQGALRRQPGLRQAELARRRDRGGQSACGVDPAGRGDSALRRGHPMVQHRRRIRRAVGAACDGWPTDFVRCTASRRRTGRPPPRITSAGCDRRPLVTEHPVVRVHPETGEKALYVNPGFTTHIEGVSAHESRRLLGLFYDELARPEYTVRFKWEPGSIAFWDNRSTVHLAPSDLTTEHDRRLYRVTLVGDVPRGRMVGRRSPSTANRSRRSDR